MPTRIQTVAGAAQFDGTAGAGLFSFEAYDRLPRTTRIVVDTIGYHAAAGGNPGDLLELYFVRPGGAPTERILIIRATGAQIVGPVGDGDVTVCSRVLPRDVANQGQQWEIRAVTSGKTVDASVMVDFVTDEFPDGEPTT